MGRAGGRGGSGWVPEHVAPPLQWRTANGASPKHRVHEPCGRVAAHGGGISPGVLEAIELGRGGKSQEAWEVPKGNLSPDGTGGVLEPRGVPQGIPETGLDQRTGMFS